MKTLIILSIGLLVSLRTLADCPKFIFFCDNPNRCDGQADFLLAVCPSTVTAPYTVDYVEWTIGGTTVTTGSLNYTHQFTTGGSFNVTATVYCTSGGSQCSFNAISTSHATPTLDNLCGTTSTNTNFNVFVSNLDFSLYVLSPTTSPIYNNQSVDIGVSYVNQSGVSPVTNVWVDGTQVVTNASTFLNPVLDNYVFGVGQHLIEMSLEDKGAFCTYNRSLLIEVLDSIDSAECSNCFTFQPLPGERYWVSAWVKVGVSGPVKTYSDLGVSLQLSYSGSSQTVELRPEGEIIDGWQRIAGEFTVPGSATQIKIELVNGNGSLSAFFDDVRVHPFNASMKSYVNDSQTFWLSAELDDNNYATFYEYDKEGKLIRIKKETERGIMTIQESRMSNPKTN